MRASIYKLGSIYSRASIFSPITVYPEFYGRYKVQTNPIDILLKIAEKSGYLIDYESFKEYKKTWLFP